MPGWPAGFEVIGPTGPRGATGPTGATGASSNSFVTQTQTQGPVDTGGATNTSINLLQVNPSVSTTGNSLLVHYNAGYTLNNNAANTAFRILVDGVQLFGMSTISTPGNGRLVSTLTSKVGPLSVGPTSSNSSGEWTWGLATSQTGATGSTKSPS